MPRRGATRRRDVPAPGSRVSLETAASLFAELLRAGHMEVILNVLRDREDMLDMQTRNALRADILCSPESLARFQQRQGAMGEIANIIATFRRLAAGAPNMANARRGLDALLADVDCS